MKRTMKRTNKELLNKVTIARNLLLDECNDSFSNSLFCLFDHLEDAGEQTICGLYGDLLITGNISELKLINTATNKVIITLKGE